MGEVDRPARVNSFSAPLPINESHDFSRFDCGKEPLNNWIRAYGKRNEARSSRCYVISGAERPAGFYSLAAGSVVHALAPRKVRQNAPDPVPVIVIGRLAVDKAFQGRGLGADLLRDALLRSLDTSRMIGVRAVLVHAIDEQAVPFYTAHDFKIFPAASLSLFLPIEHIAKAL